MIARPLYYGFIPMDVGWKVLMDWALQVVDPVELVGHFSSSVLRRLLLQRCLRVSAFFRLSRKSAEATALAVGSILVGGAL